MAKSNGSVPRTSTEVISNGPCPEGETVTQVPPVSSEVDPLLTQSEVARMCGKSPSTIGQWIAQGLLEFQRQPSGLRAIRKSVIDRFLGATCLKLQK